MTHTRLSPLLSLVAVLLAPAPAVRPALAQGPSAPGSAAQEVPSVPVPVIVTDEPKRPSVTDLPIQAGLPDPLALAGGGRVTTAADWPQRRAEIEALLRYYAAGGAPPAPGNVEGRELRRVSLLDGDVEYRLVHLTFGPGDRLGFDLAVFVPTKRKGAVPTIVFPTFDATPGADVLPTMPRRPEQGQGKDSLRLPLGIPPDPALVKKVPLFDPAEAAVRYRKVFERGYALAMFHYQDCGEDTIARNADGSWAFRNTRFFPAYPRHEWGLLAAWAWGMSRAIDYLETEPFVDRSAFVLVGHSRIGKAVLVAGALDARIALVAPAGSAGGGVGAYRSSGAGRGGGEGFEDMLRKYPNWFSPHLAEFKGELERLPFDQHFFIAATAPRRFLALEGTGDTICSPTAVRASLDGARPVYALHGVTQRMAVHYSEHAHALDAEDWEALLDFADRELRGIATTRSFDNFPSSAPPAAIAPLAESGP